VPGRIREEDIAEVREKVRIEEVVGDYVTLRNAGGGSLKGLCPFHDEKTPSFNVNPQRGFFHCLAGETMVLTWAGARPIAELAGGVHKILDVHGQWVEAPFASYGVQRLHRITVTRNRQRKEIYATDGHRWFIRNGAGGRGSKEVVTTGLRAGDRLVQKFPRSRIQRTTPSPFGIAHGFTYGDGTRSGTGSMALVCPPKDAAVLKYFPQSHTTASGPNLLVHHLPRFFKELPDRDESVSYLYGWLAGYVAADGCVAADGTVMLNSADRADLAFVRDVCTRLGIGTYGITTQSRVGFPGREPSDVHRVHFVNDDLTPEFFVVPAHRERFEAATKKYARRGWVVQSVEQTDRVEEVYCAEVEDGHAFTLEDNILTGNCFGCGEGGDAVSFLMKIDGLGFTETMERLAEKVGVVLRRDEDDERPERPKGPPRQRLVEANRLAQEFYAEHLGAPDAVEGRRFLQERGFDQAAAEHFGVGFAPRDGEALVRHLRGRGFSVDELVAADLAGVGRSAYDRFRGRLLWPIRDPGGHTIGFGARRIFDDDRVDAKYLNTRETPLYKKSQVLYGIDLARRSIGTSSQAVVVEGYTDVMACHLAGVTTAVASCGTAFGPEHTRVLRRFLLDDATTQGEVVFTFDGDEAGQAAALKAFKDDDKYVGQTYVTVQPEGLDPCDLRIRDGDVAVRDLIARREPLYRFVLRNLISKYDLDRADSRVDAVREAAALVVSSRDSAVAKGSFAREISALTGVDPNDVQAEVERVGRSRGQAPVPAPARPPRGAVPDLRDPRFAIERETLKLVLQHPIAVGRTTADIGANDFTHPTYRGVWELVAAAGGVVAGTDDQAWVSRLRDAATDPAVSSVISALAVEPLMRAPDASYVAQYVYKLLELTASRRIDDVKAKMQRTHVDAPGYLQMFGELAALEQYRRQLRDRMVGES
jgi:DNA primase